MMLANGNCYFFSHIFLSLSLSLSNNQTNCDEAISKTARVLVSKNIIIFATELNSHAHAQTTVHNIVIIIFTANAENR